jgi:hypothetical protein
MSRVSCGKYGDHLDLSTSDFVECTGCKRRFVGGDFESRLARWLAHSQDTGCSGAKAREASAE